MTPTRVRATIWVMRVVSIVVCMAAATACTYTGPAGQSPDMTFTFGPQPAAAPPPPGMESAPPRPHQGQYIGNATVATDPGEMGACANINLQNFSVSGNNVSFGRFYGTIRPDGSLYMQAGDTFVNGRFYGPHFHGQYWAPGGCSYTLSLDPAQA